jgi:uncharacterized phage protein (TIGR01671 family)
MSREIKFRTWNTRNKMTEGVATLEELVLADPEVIGDHYRTRVDDLIWMQYTGLKDKEGKEIYEGDVYEYLWDSGGGLEKRVSVLSDYPYDVVNHIQGQLGGEVEIIGNIYENPELIEE